MDGISQIFYRKEVEWLVLPNFGGDWFVDHLCTDCFKGGFIFIIVC